MHKIVFLGTPDFAVPILKKLIGTNFQPFLVVAQPDKPVGRKQTLIAPPTKQLALQNNIAVAQPTSKQELTDLFSKLEVDVCILVAYGMIIPKAVLDVPNFGFLNIHPSKLPHYRGPSPIQVALANGDNKTAVTLMKLTDAVDAGPILAQVDVAIKSTDNYLSLSQQLSEVGAELVIKTLPDYLSNKVKLVNQDDSQATYCQLIKRTDGLVNWQKSAKEIYQQFKALTPWPGLFTYLDGKRLKITNLAVLEGNFKGQAVSGQVFLSSNNELAVACSEGAVQLLSVQLEGKKETSGIEFIRGYSNMVGKILT